MTRLSDERRVLRAATTQTTSHRARTVGGRDTERAAPPRILDPILAIWEGFDRLRRRIRPMRTDGILGLEVARHRGRPVALADGTIVRPGDLVGEVHLRNRRVRDLEARDGLAAAFREGRVDLRALATWAGRQPPAGRPVAYHGAGIMARFAARDRWEMRPRPRTPWRRVEDWYFRWLLARWAPSGRERLRRGHGPLSSVDAWTSERMLRHRYGGGPQSEPVVADPTAVGGRRGDVSPSGGGAESPTAAAAVRAWGE